MSDLPPPSPFLPAGVALGRDRYVIEAVLGQGGFGITYRARDQQLQRWVAIKEFFPAGCVRDGNTARAQTGFLYHYAFSMIIGLLVLLSWLLYTVNR